MSYNLSYDIRGYWLNSFLNDMVIFKLLSFSRNINNKLMLLYNKTHRTTLRLQQET